MATSPPDAPTYHESISALRPTTAPTASRNRTTAAATALRIVLLDGPASSPGEGAEAPSGDGGGPGAATTGPRCEPPGGRMGGPPHAGGDGGPLHEGRGGWAGSPNGEVGLPAGWAVPPGGPDAGAATGWLLHAGGSAIGGCSSATTVSDGETESSVTPGGGAG